MNPKILCLYLPQFHAIPENDEWWGKGFTEWTNVKRGKAFYPGHYQPRIPLGGDYYDLSDGKVLDEHTKLAKRSGIYGFCFYHYYFDGRKLLESPIEYYRDRSGEDFRYCLAWANQSFARTWYRSGNNRELLLKQKYGREKEWGRHFNYLLSYFKDDRYIKVGNKPMYLIYLPQDILCRKEMFQYWNKLAKDNGFDGIYLVAMVTGYGMDEHDYYEARMYFEPTHMFYSDSGIRRNISTWKAAHTHYLDIDHKRFRNSLFSRNIYTYRYLCEEIEKKNTNKMDWNIFPGVFSGWDNTPRKDEDGVIVRGSNPELFQNHLGKIMNIAKENDKEFIFINAWNEWSEGAYLEPDEKFGYGYLDAISKVVGNRM